MISISHVSHVLEKYNEIPRLSFQHSYWIFSSTGNSAFHILSYIDQVMTRPFSFWTTSSMMKRVSKVHHMKRKSSQTINKFSKWSLKQYFSLRKEMVLFWPIRWCRKWNLIVANYFLSVFLQIVSNILSIKLSIIWKWHQIDSHIWIEMTNRCMICSDVESNLLFVVNRTFDELIRT